MEQERQNQGITLLNAGNHGSVILHITSINQSIWKTSDWVEKVINPVILVRETRCDHI